MPQCHSNRNGGNSCAMPGKTLSFKNKTKQNKIEKFPGINFHHFADFAPEDDIENRVNFHQIYIS